MANITTENLGLNHSKIVVTVTPQDYLSAFDKKLKQYAKTASINGFRKGMVPAGLIKKMYGPAVFHEEVIGAVEAELGKYIEQEKINYFAQPVPQAVETQALDMNNPKDFTVAFEIGIRPNIDLNLAKLNLTKYNIEVEDKFIDEDVQHNAKRFGADKEIDSVETDTDLIAFDAVEVDENNTKVEGGVSGVERATPRYFNDEIAKSLIGKKVGDAVTGTLAEVFEPNSVKYIANTLKVAEDSTTRFQFTITKITNLVPAELNEDLYKQVFATKEIKTEEEFRDALKEEVAKSFESQSLNQLNDGIYHALLDDTKVEMPEKFLKLWLKKGDAQHPKTDEEVEAEYPKFANSLKWTLITDKICTENNIEVKKEDFVDFAKKSLMQYMGGMSVMGEELSWLDDYATKMASDKKFIDENYYRIQSEKMFNYVQTQVKPTEKSISFDDFKHMVENHHH